MERFANKEKNIKNILCFTENYSVGGGNRYLTDVINSIPANVPITITSNKDGIFDYELERIRRPYVYKSINTWSMQRLRKIIGLEENALIIKIFLKIILRFMYYFILPIFYYHNRMLLEKLIKDTMPNLIIIFNGGYPGAVPCLDMAIESSRLNIFTILHIGSMPRKKTLLERLLYKMVNVRMDFLLVNAEEIKKALIKEERLAAEKIIVINNSVNLNVIFHPEIFLQRTGLNMGRKSKIIGYIGRIELKKGIFYLIKAFSMVINEIKDIKLVLVGIGDDFDKAKRYINKLNIENSVILTGFYNGNIYDVLYLFDIFILPSLWEGLPHSILEAMNAERIIIATNVGGIPEAIENRRDGILVPAADTDILASTIKDVINNLEHYRYLGINAKGKVRKMFSMQGFEKKVNDMIFAGIN